MKSKNKGRFTGRMGASAPVMMLLRSMTCSGQRSRTIASAFVLDRAYALTGRGGCVASTLMASSPPYTWSVLRWTRRGGRCRARRRTTRRPGRRGARWGRWWRARRRDRARTRRGNSWLRSSPPRARGGGGGGGAVRAEGGANSLAHSLAGDGVRAVAHAGRVGGEGVVAIRVVARPPVHAGEHVHEVLAEVAAAAYDERATFRRHLDGKHRDRRRDVTDRGPRARLDACTEHGRGPRRMSWFREIR